MAAGTSWQKRLGLDRPELRAWALYDFAISPVQTTVMVAVFPIFYIQVAGAEAGGPVAAQWWAISNGIAITIVALLSPILGALADFTAAKKKMLAASMVPGVAACAGMFVIGRGDLMLASALFVLAAIGAAAAATFYDSLLPHIASQDSIDRVSASGFAVGYMGGGALLTLNLLMIAKPAWFGLGSSADLAVRLSMVIVALWWAAFSIPLFRVVPEPPRALEIDEEEGANPVRVAFTRLAETLRELRGFRQAFLMLVAFLIYNDGVSTIQKMAAAYGTELGIGRESLISAILIVQFVGVPATFLFGLLGSRIGAKRAIFVALTVYLVISIVGYFMKTSRDFYLLAILVGLVQGGVQALSRSLFSTMIPRHKSGEFFGFYSVFSKFAGIFGPFLFAGIIGATGSSRNAILAVIAFFIVGGALLAFVDVEKGEQAARAADAGTRSTA
jgi:UMF1 family MFS transporter